jgi:ABC-type multidrug transport system fused ATPase/permease subunit
MNYKRKKNLLIVLAIILTLIGLSIITCVITGWIPLVLILTIPFLGFIIFKLGKDVDKIIDKMFLEQILNDDHPIFDGLSDMMDEEE